MSERRRIGSLLLEVFLIVLSVMLALAVSEWQAAAGDRDRAADALVAIAEEIRDNRAELTRSLDYHVALLDTLRTLEAPPQPWLFDQGFTRPANLQDAAWQIAIATDVLRHLPPEQAHAIARVYAEQQRYTITARGVTEPLFDMLFSEGAVGVVRNYRNLLSVISALWFREARLTEVYADVLSTLEE